MCSCGLSQTVGCRCCSTVTTTSYSSWLTSWCDFFMAHLSVTVPSVCSTCAQPVETCWVDTATLSYAFCVQKHLSALCEKMLVFLQSLPCVIEGKYGGWNFFWPACYLLLSLSQNPSHTYSSSHILYIFTAHLFFSLSNLMSILWQAVNCINSW